MPDGDLAFDVGQQISWQIGSPTGGKLFVFDIGASGAVRQIFPNSEGRNQIWPAGQTRLLPAQQDGVTVFMGPDSRIQVWLAVMLPSGQDYGVPMVGDPRVGAVSGGAAGLLENLTRWAEAGQAIEFALTVFGQTIPPLLPEDVETALGLDRQQAAVVQGRLNDLGFDVGMADGLLGRNTRAGLAAWQASEGLDETGYLNTYTLRRLLDI